MKLTRSFVAGIMNMDIDERLLPKSQYREAHNVEIGTSEGSDIGAVQNSLGNTNVSDLSQLVNTNAKCIGSVTDPAGFKLYWFVTSANADYIFEYDELSGSTVQVIKAQKVTTTTPSILNFRGDYIITGANYMDGFLYWTDNLNPPRKLNIKRAKAWLVDGFTEDDISVIVKPPIFPPTFILSVATTVIGDVDPNITNNLEDKFIYFAYRYKYLDDQYSAMSPFSAVAFFPKNFSIDYGTGDNIAMINRYNQAQITFNTGDEQVEEIQLLFRDTRNLNIKVVETFKKSDEGWGDNIDIPSPIIFQNNKVYTVLSADQLPRLFDNVPLLAKAQDIIGGRLIYGNYSQYYDIVDSNGQDIELNYEVGITTNLASMPNVTFRSDRDYEVGI